MKKNFAIWANGELIANIICHEDLIETFVCSLNSVYKDIKYKQCYFESAVMKSGAIKR